MDISSHWIQIWILSHHGIKLFISNGHNLLPQLDWWGLQTNRVKACMLRFSCKHSHSQWKRCLVSTYGIAYVYVCMSKFTVRSQESHDIFYNENTVTCSKASTVRTRTRCALITCVYSIALKFIHTDDLYEADHARLFMLYEMATNPIALTEPKFADWHFKTPYASYISWFCCFTGTRWSLDWTVKIMWLKLYQVWRAYHWTTT